MRNNRDEIYVRIEKNRFETLVGGKLAYLVVLLFAGGIFYYLFG